MVEKRAAKRPVQLSLTLLLLLVALVASLLAAWRLWRDVPDVRNWNQHHVRTGMSYDEVARIMGEPYSESDDAWLYRIRLDEKRERLTIEVTFVNGHVKGVRRGCVENSSASLTC